MLLNPDCNVYWASFLACCDSFSTNLIHVFSGWFSCCFYYFSVHFFFSFNIVRLQLLCWMFIMMQNLYFFFFGLWLCLLSLIIIHLLFQWRVELATRILFYAVSQLFLGTWHFSSSHFHLFELFLWAFNLILLYI